MKGNNCVARNTAVPVGSAEKPFVQPCWLARSESGRCAWDEAGIPCRSLVRAPGCLSRPQIARGGNLPERQKQSRCCLSTKIGVSQPLVFCFQRQESMLQSLDESVMSF